MSDLDQHLAAIVDGDPDAFARWVAAAEPSLRRSLFSFAARVDAEAVVQEALLRVWQVAPRFAPDGRPDGLLRLGIRIARNLAIDELRRIHARPHAADHVAGDESATAAPSDFAADPMADSMPDPLLRRVIAACRALLRGKPADALAARLASGGSDEDEVLAARLGMRLNTFLQNFTRARKQLAACLRKHGVDVPEVLA